MLHWIRPEPLAFAGARDGAAVPASPLSHDPPQRAVHARMLAYAASRRRAAAASLRNDCRIDALYWKSGAPNAVARARALRLGGLASLP
jgi:hypothetical protein